MRFSLLNLLLITMLFSAPITATSIDKAVQLAIDNSRLISLSEGKQRLAEIKHDRTNGNAWMSASIDWNKGEQSRKANSITGDGRQENYRSRTLSVTQPLFRGFQSLHEKKAAHFELESMDHELSEQITDVALSATGVYLNVVKTEQSLLFYKEIMRCSNEILRLVKQQHRLKLISQSQLATFQSDHLQLQSAYISMQKEKAAADVEYYFVVGINPDDLDLPTLPSMNEQSVSDTDHFLEHNPTALKYKALRNSAKSSVRRSKGALLPSVQFVGDFEKQESVLYLDNEDLETSTYYINVSLPIFQRGSRIFDIQQAKESYALSKQELALNISRLESELNKSIAMLKISYSSLESFQKLEKSSQDQVTDYLELLKVSAIDRVAVLDAKIALNQIKLQKLSAEVECLTYFYQYQSLLGNVSKQLTGV